jgi:hypothetical protein
MQCSRVLQYGVVKLTMNCGMKGANVCYVCLAPGWKEIVMRFPVTVCFVFLH